MSTIPPVTAEEKKTLPPSYDAVDQDLFGHKYKLAGAKTAAEEKNASISSNKMERRDLGGSFADAKTTPSLNEAAVPTIFSLAMEGLSKFFSCS